MGNLILHFKVLGVKIKNVMNFQQNNLNFIHDFYKNLNFKCL